MFGMSLLRTHFPRCSSSISCSTIRHFTAKQHVFSRTFAQAVEPSVKPPKPKATTPLRRAAAASLPIRSNPTPTRGSIQPVFTLATSERYLLDRIRERAPLDSQILHDAIWVPKWKADAKEGEIFIFENGTFVCWGLGKDEAEKFASDVIKPMHAELAPLDEIEDEELEFVTDPSQDTRLQGDLIILGQTPPPQSEELPTNLPPSVLPQDTLLARYAFSQALSRSTALSGLETSLDQYLYSVAGLPDSLISSGKPGLRRRELVKKLGELLKFRQGLNLNRENFYDTPDFYWAEPVLENYFNSLSNALEMRARIKALNDKITYAAEVQSVLRQLLTETSSHRMELVIIALISVEVVICLIRDGPELWEMAFGKPEPKHEGVIEVRL